MNSKIAFVFLAFSITFDSCCGRQESYKKILGEWYYFEDARFKFTDAIDNCKAQFGGSGKLFEPLDQITNDAVVSHAQSVYPDQVVWIGIHTLPDPAPRKFHHVSKLPSAPLAFNGWGSGEPNNVGEEDCVQVSGLHGLRWNDMKCSATGPSICQIAKQMEQQDCSIFPQSMNKVRSETGCPGAVWANGLPSKQYCKGQNSKGVGGLYPWWSNCCNWDGSVCKPIGPSGQCQDQRGNRMRCYGLKAVTCSEGCDVQDTGYDCTDQESNSNFVVICPIVNAGNCIAHLLTDKFTCRQCCRTRDCGTYLHKCKFTGGDKRDVCPPDGQGCPYWEVVSSNDFDNPTDQYCTVDPLCDTVMSGDHLEIGSGVSCRKSDRSREFKKKFCCASNDPNIVTNLPRC